MSLCHNSQRVHLIHFHQLQCISVVYQIFCDSRGVRILPLLSAAHTQPPLPRWAMWRWRGWTTTELPLSVGLHSPSIKQEGFLCTLWLINHLCKLEELYALSALWAPMIQVCWLVTLTQHQNTPFLWMSAQQGANWEAFWVQVSPCYISDWANIYGRHVANWTKFKFYVYTCWPMLFQMPKPFSCYL